MMSAHHSTRISRLSGVLGFFIGIFGAMAILGVFFKILKLPYFEIFMVIGFVGEAVASRGCPVESAELVYGPNLGLTHILDRYLELEIDGIDAGRFLSLDRWRTHSIIDVPCKGDNPAKIPRHF